MFVNLCSYLPATLSETRILLSTARTPKRSDLLSPTYVYQSPGSHGPVDAFSLHEGMNFPVLILLLGLSELVRASLACEHSLVEAAG
jgi:hypothetical protein